jgi:hypothetical protein
MAVNTDLPFEKNVWEGPETFGRQRAVGPRVNSFTPCPTGRKRRFAHYQFADTP